jgi:superfamily II DNA/RNA helicase
MVFCNDCRETEHLCLYAHSLAPAHFVDKLLWFHSGMSTRFRTDTIKKLCTHKIWGILCTDAAGMVHVVVWLWIMLIVCQGLDLHNIKLVVQWRYTLSLCTLWQRLGWAAWDPSTEVTGIYMVEPQYMDQKHNEAEKRAAGRTGKSKQKRARGVPEANNGPAQKHIHPLDEDAGPSAQDGSQIQSVQPVD